MRTALFSFFVIAAPALAMAAPTIGRAVVVRGNVAVSRDGASLQLKPGDSLLEADTVETQKGGLVHVLMSDNSLINLGEASRITLSSVKTGQTKPRTSVRLIIGRLWARVAKSLSSDTSVEVATENAVAGVRGTSFIAEFLDGRSVITVDSGEVEVVDVQKISRRLLKRQRSLVTMTEHKQEPVEQGELDQMEGELAAESTDGDGVGGLGAPPGGSGNGTSGQGQGAEPARSGTSLPPLDLDPGTAPLGGGKSHVRGRIVVQ